MKKPDNNKQTNYYALIFTDTAFYFCTLSFLFYLHLLASKITHVLTSSGLVNQILTLYTEISNRFVRFLFHLNVLL